uniref:Putative secreted protein n=1 Tax=Anopheles darlingi TaxID=43151 RepID=A0A2M4D1F2_ANODA
MRTATQSLSIGSSLLLCSVLHARTGYNGHKLKLIRPQKDAQTDTHNTSGAAIRAINQYANCALLYTRTTYTEQLVPRKHTRVHFSKQ